MTEEKKVIVVSSIKKVHKLTPEQALAWNWVNEKEEEIKRLMLLTKGWNSYDADPPNTIARDNLIKVLNELGAQNFLEGRVTPSAEGGLAIVFNNENKYADIECFNNGEILAIVSDLPNRSIVWAVSEDPDSTSKTSYATIKAIKEFLQ